MNAIHVPAEIVQVGDSLVRFVEQEVVPLETTESSARRTSKASVPGLDEPATFSSAVQAMT